jgi:hypothetical protein
MLLGLGRVSGQLKVAVAVWIVPGTGGVPVTGPVASAIMVALPVPYAVTIPAFAPPLGTPDPLLFTGKTLGAEVSHCTELVRSLVVGGVEYVPMARNCPLSRRLPTVIVLGMIWSESSGSGAGVSVTVSCAELVTSELSGFFNSAVIVLVPRLTPVAWPFPEARPLETVATDGILEIHWSCGELVTSSSSPVVPEVASAMNWPTWPEAETDWEFGTIVTSVNSSVVPPCTVKVAVAESVLPPLL